SKNTLNTESGEIRKQIQKRLVPHYSFLNEQLIQTIIDEKDSFAINTNNKWHRFSLKTMKVLIPELLNRSTEQMTLLSEMGLLKKDQKKYQNNKYVPYKQIAQDIYNPVAAKSVREALKIVNAVLKKYGEISYIVIEMPRDKNEDEEKKQIEQFQKDNKKEKNAAFEAFSNDINDQAKLNKTLKHRKQLYTEIRLWYQQDKHCLYSGKYIDANELLNSPELFDIDHIIPQSISFDDSINNKTLCYADMNRNKDQKTPFEFMNDGGGQGWDKFKAIVSSNHKLNKYKKKNLLLDENVSDIEVRKRFIARNLVDTTYSSRVVLNSLQEFFSEKELPTKVTVIRGKFTSNMRKHWHLNKSRDTYYHHA
ncbi:type II CRISPR RNA-guided endonuclease Cas9, partial [Lactobacillus sp. XV13L]|nr:type II CRISPR RNA-guided endonuclease Cas9 [Lactobacillus sp. XV13L]